MVLLIPYHANRFLLRSGADPWFGGPLAYAIHAFHMPLFFVLSGYLAAAAVTRRGALESARERLRRIGLPLVAAMVTIIPLINLALAFGAAKKPGPLPPQRTLELGNVFTAEPLILWFLIYLLVLTIAAIVFWALLRGTRAAGTVNSAFRRLLASPLAVPVLAAGAAAVLLTTPAWEAPKTVGGDLVPDPTLLAYYGLFLGFGWMLAQNRDLVPRVERAPAVHLLAGSAAVLAGYLLFTDRVALAGQDGARALALLLGPGLACWLLLFGFWGAFARLLPRARPAVRYVADASFWIYLIHLPILLPLEYELQHTGLPVELRFALAVLGSLVGALLTYALFVRHTPIGSFLGARAPRRKRPQPPLVTAPATEEAGPG